MSSTDSSHSTYALLQPSAPAKPPVGAPCNGCGLCCLLEPCPLGMLLSRKRRGACHWLRWSDAQQRYLCGAISDAPQGLAGQLRVRLARRWIAAGLGCDAQVQAVPAQVDTPPP